MAERSLCTSIIRLNAEAVDARAFEAAYHLLAAALHVADGLNDRDGIEAVINLATEQGAAVDAIENHPMASVNAIRRGTTPLYQTLVTIARAKLLQLDSQHLIDKDRHSADD